MVAGGGAGVFGFGYLGGGRGGDIDDALQRIGIEGDAAGEDICRELEGEHHGADENATGGNGARAHRARLDRGFHV